MMNKTKMAVLEKAFAAEIEGRLPFQTKSKVAVELCESGHLAPDERIIHGVTVKGYSLTLLGNYVYCSSCADQPEP